MHFILVYIKLKRKEIYCNYVFPGSKNKDSYSLDILYKKSFFFVSHKLTATEFSYRTFLSSCGLWNLCLKWMSKDNIGIWVIPYSIIYSFSIFGTFGMALTWLPWPGKLHLLGKFFLWEKRINKRGKWPTFCHSISFFEPFPTSKEKKLFCSLLVGIWLWLLASILIIIYKM